MKKLICFSLSRLITLYFYSRPMAWWVSTFPSGASYFSSFHLVFINMWKIISYDHLKMSQKAFSWVSLTKYWILSAYEVFICGLSVFLMGKFFIWPQCMLQPTLGGVRLPCDVKSAVLYSFPYYVLVSRYPATWPA